MNFSADRVFEEHRRERHGQARVRRGLGVDRDGGHQSGVGKVPRRTAARLTRLIYTFMGSTFIKFG